MATYGSQPGTLHCPQDDMPHAPPPLRIFIVDDHPVVRQGVRMLLEQAGMTVVGTASTSDDARAGVAATHPDVALVDLRLDNDDGRPLLRELARGDRPRLLVYSMAEDAASIGESLDAGAHGYVTKGEVWETLVEALSAVAVGQCYLSPRACRALDAPVSANATTQVKFSSRESEVYRLLGDGFTGKEIGAKLDVSPRTVESYCARLQEKLSLPGMRELRRHAIAARKR